MSYLSVADSPMRNSSDTVATSDQAREPKKLILCFDGTGNTFSGSSADTNVVKILSQLDRNDSSQHHYYQPGIGTYDVNEHSINKSWLGEIKSSIDQAFGTTFDAHVMAGYRFLMRYYESGDKIYLFGFSRGAFTAKFLARMIYTVGLLCEGNEEMVPFAYRLYQDYLAGKTKDAMAAHPEREKTGADVGGHGDDMKPRLSIQDDTHNVPHGDMYEHACDEITKFSNDFCRKEQTNDGGQSEGRNIKVYFLGMWDCVNSVAVLEQKTSVPATVRGTAHFIRHAVAVDERRVKFKAALLAQDIRASDPDHEDIKEVWFPGCHGDVGGGWPTGAGESTDGNKGMTFRQRMKNVRKRRNSAGPSEEVGSDPLQMSDIPLAWMIRELELVGERDPSAAIKWSNDVNDFKHRIQKHKEQALRGIMHDSLWFGRGKGFFTVLMWKFLEYFPLITRWELVGNSWVNVRFPLNKGETRDIPIDAVLHESLLWRLHNNPSYQPLNNHGGVLPPCLKHKGRIAPVDPVPERQGPWGPDHSTYTFAKVPTYNENER